MRSAARKGVSFNTIAKLLVDAGNACADYHDKTVYNVTVGFKWTKSGPFATPRPRTLSGQECSGLRRRRVDLDGPGQ